MGMAIASRSSMIKTKRFANFLCSTPGVTLCTGVFFYIFGVAVPCSNWAATWVAHRLFDWIPPDSLSRPLF